MDIPASDYATGSLLGASIRKMTEGTYNTIMRNKRNVLIIAILITVLVLAVLAYIETKNCDTSIDQVIAHYACKSGGGCGLDCPYSDLTIPKNKAQVYLNTIQLLKKHVNAAASNDKDEMDALKQIVKPEGENIKTLESIAADKQKYLTQINTIALTADNVSKRIGSDITASALENLSRLSGYEGSVYVYKNMFALAMMRGSSFLMYSKILSMPEDVQKRIDGYEAKSTLASTYVNSIKQMYEDMASELNSGVKQSVDNLLGESKNVLLDTSMVLAFSQKLQEVTDVALGKYKEILSTNQECMIKSGFTNKLPNTLEAKDMNSLIEQGDFNTALIKTALEADLVKNHSKYAKERASFSSGGGIPSVRDDDNDIVKWVGLFGRPNYRKSDGTPIERSSEPLKSIPSDKPEDLMRTNTVRLTYN